MPPDDRVRAARQDRSVSASVEVPNGAIVSGFSPINTEFNPVPLLRTLSKGGARLALPKVVGRGKPAVLARLELRAEPPRRGRVGHSRNPDVDAPEVAPDIVARSFTAFDRAGYRIGYGAGYLRHDARRPAGEEEDSSRSVLASRRRR